MVTAKERSEAVRPTEAQLRWAQFHHKNRALAVQEQVERLYQTPALVSDVPDAHSDDGLTTDEGSSVGSSPSPLYQAKNERRRSTVKRRESTKPKISRGRRAFLRVSKRAYEKRRAEIVQRGFQCRDEEVGEEDDIVNVLLEEEPTISTTDTTAATSTQRKRHRKRRHTLRRPQQVMDDDDRVLRFEAAYHAMMMNLAPRQQPEIIMAPSKRWTRSADTPVAVSIDGRQYDDLKWGFTKKLAPVHSAGYADPATPVDRRASWLVHLPERQSLSTSRFAFAPTAVDANGQPIEPVHALSSEARMMILSPGEIKFDELVATLQQREIEHQRRLEAEGNVLHKRKTSSATKFRQRYTRKYGSLGDREETVERLESHASKKSPRVGAGEENPLRTSLESPSSDAESEFWKSARNMHDTTTAPERDGDSPRTMKLRTPVINSRKQLNPPSVGNAASLHSPTTESDVDSEFWTSARNMRDTTPNVTGTPEALGSADSYRRADDSQTERRVVTSKDGPSIESPVAESPVQSELLHSETNGHDKTPSVDIDSIPGFSSYSDEKPKSGGQEKHQRLSLKSTGNGTDEQSRGDATHDADSDFWQNTRDMGNSLSPPSQMSSSDRCRNPHHDKFFEKGLKAAPGAPGESPMTQSVASPSSYGSDQSVDGPDCSLSSTPREGQSYVETSRNRHHSKFALKGYAGPGAIGEAPTSPSETSTTVPLESSYSSVVPNETRLSTPKDGVSSPELDRNRYHDKFLENGRSAPNWFGMSTLDQSGRSDEFSSTQERDQVASEEPVAAPVASIETSGLRKVGARVGGLFNSVFAGSKADEEEDLRAVAAFKKMHNDRRVPNDDATSASSYKILPEGIRRVVQNFSVSKGKDPPAIHEVLGEKDTFAGVDTGKTADHAAVSPVRAGSSRSDDGEYSPEHGKAFHQRILEHSALIGDADADQTIIDTDGASLASDDPKMDPHLAASLFLSPTILTKRHQQAIRAIERQKWEQVSYLVSANPWLAEMTDVTTAQYLLHKLALYGGGVPLVDPQTGEVSYTEPAPEKLNLDLIRMFPSSVHKFDQDGNLPLHMAAVSGNKRMVELLGERFPSGASVRNNEGLLPLHLAIQACPSVAADGDVSSASGVIKAILRHFPGAVAVAENDGNLPIHCAASSLHGEVGVDVVYMLLDEAERQVQNGTIFRTSDNKLKRPLGLDDDEFLSEATDATATVTESSAMADEGVYCSLVRNKDGHNPLASAIRARAGWEMVEAIAGGPGGKHAALQSDPNMNSALHLLVSKEFADPAALLSVLRVAPAAAAGRNVEGVLPIELASMHRMPREIILSLALVDLPIDLEEKEGVKIRENFGGSWWFLTCECDDHHLDIVLEVIALCSYEQTRELCFMKGTPAQGNGTVILRATPRCRDELRKALRFLGRFEFVGGAATEYDAVPGLKVFEALDFGDEEDDYEGGRRVILRCYALESSFMGETLMLRKFDLDTNFVEEAFDFAISEFDDQSQESAPQQFCVVVEQPTLTLDQVVAGMLKNGDYRTKPDMRNRYLSKVSMVLRLIAKALRYLHQEGVVHGNVRLETIGKYEDTWKLADMLRMQPIGGNFHGSRMGEASPPEALSMRRDVVEGASSSRQVAFVGDLTTSAAFDIWGFGKLAYEVFTGIPLVSFNSEDPTRLERKALRIIFQWGEDNLRDVVDNLRQAGVPTLGADLISHCLLSDPQQRPVDMDEVLEHPFWRDMRRRSAPSQSRAERRHPNEI